MTFRAGNGRRAMPRRTILRGMFHGSAITLGLPVLDAMLNNSGTAYAFSGNPTGTFFGTFHWAHGTIRELFFPSGPGVGAAWSLNQHTMPLQGVKDYLSFGLGNGIGAHGHRTGQAIITTGGPALCNGGGSASHPTLIAAKASIDQEVKDAFAKLPGEPKKSLVLGLYKGLLPLAGPGVSTISYGGCNNHIAPEYDPQKAFNDLFGSFMPTTPTSPGGAPDPRLALWPSILDVVKDELAGVMKELGPKDRMRLDQHLTDVTALQKQLVAPPPPVAASCTKPATAPSAMAQIVALGLSCGLARVFSYNVVNDGMATPWANHGDSHYAGANPGGKAKVETNVVEVMKLLAGLLEALRNQPAGGGKNLLDKSAILCFSSIASGPGHKLTSDLPVFLAGKADGRLRGNVCANNPNGFRMHVTALRALGFNVDGYGTKAGFQTAQWGSGHYLTDGTEATNTSVAGGARPGPASPFSYFQSADIPDFMV